MHLRMFRFKIFRDGNALNRLQCSLPHSCSLCRHRHATLGWSVAWRHKEKPWSRLLTTLYTYNYRYPSRAVFPSPISFWPSQLFCTNATPTPYPSSHHQLLEISAVVPTLQLKKATLLHLLWKVRYFLLFSFQMSYRVYLWSVGDYLFARSIWQLHKLLTTKWFLKLVAQVALF